ncbi:MAG TPA: hypothetical protein V6C65_26580, partial [Allocoleopsis sp.]
MIRIINLLADPKVFFKVLSIICYLGAIANFITAALGWWRRDWVMLITSAVFSVAFVILAIIIT